MSECESVSVCMCPCVCMYVYVCACLCGLAYMRASVRMGVLQVVQVSRLRNEIWRYKCMLFTLLLMEHMYVIRLFMVDCCNLYAVSFFPCLNYSYSVNGRTVKLSDDLFPF